MNLLRFSKPLNYLSFPESAINQFLGDLEKENCFDIPLARPKKILKLSYLLQDFQRIRLEFNIRIICFLLKGLQMINFMKMRDICPGSLD